MPCNCGGGSVRYDTLRTQPAVRAQPSYGIRLNQPRAELGGNPSGAQRSSPNKVIERPKAGRTQV